MPASAQAICIRGFSYDFDSQLNAELEYLICLHNEQAVQIADLTTKINSLSRDYNYNVLKFDEISQTTSNLLGYIQELQTKIQADSLRFDELSQRVTDLENLDNSQ